MKTLICKFTEKQLNNIKNVAESLYFTFDYNKKDNYFNFSIYSPQNQDFEIEVNANNIKELQEELYKFWDNYNVDDEAILWYGMDKGEPKSLKTLLKDMEWCKRISGRLYNKVNHIK